MRKIIAIAVIAIASPAAAQTVCFSGDYGCQHRQWHDRQHELSMQRHENMMREFDQRRDHDYLPLIVPSLPYEIRPVRPDQIPMIQAR